MKNLPENVRKLLDATALWVLTTSDEEPNGAPIFFKKIDEQGNLVMFDLFMNKTKQNVCKNGKGTVVVYNSETLEGYQIKGTASYVTDEALVAEGNVVASRMGVPVVGAVVVKPETIVVQTPGGENGKLL